MSVCKKIDELLDYVNDINMPENKEALRKDLYYIISELKEIKEILI